MANIHKNTNMPYSSGCRIHTPAIFADNTIHAVATDASNTDTNQRGATMKTGASICASRPLSFKYLFLAKSNQPVRNVAIEGLSRQAGIAFLNHISSIT
ncbi:MAG: hypothetical protein K2L75_08430 [Muribaculaceae bacterium]|nr:hypothetical protein [Muribaculaceae bacterium]